MQGLLKDYVGFQKPSCQIPPGCLEVYVGFSDAMQGVFGGLCRGFYEAMQGLLKGHVGFQKPSCQIPPPCKAIGQGLENPVEKSTFDL